MNSQDRKCVEATLELYWLKPNRIIFEKEFNRLLIHPNHYQHQKLLLELQTRCKYQSSVEYIETLFNQKYEEYFAYTGSDNYVINRWLTWALIGIGSKKSYEMLLKYKNEIKNDIGEHVKYRLEMIELIEDKIIVNKERPKIVGKENKPIKLSFWSKIKTIYNRPG